MWPASPHTDDLAMTEADYDRPTAGEHSGRRVGKPRAREVPPDVAASPQPRQESRVPVIRGVVCGHVVAAIGVLRARLAEPWSLDALAEEVHLSRSQLVRAFDATAGMSPMAYLRQMRVERMARPLASTDLSVAEAARSVGWRSQFRASQCFHAAYGVSPTEYRHRHTPSPLR